MHDGPHQPAVAVNNAARSLVIAEDGSAVRRGGPYSSLPAQVKKRLSPTEPLPVGARRLRLAKALNAADRAKKARCRREDRDPGFEQASLDLGAQRIVDQVRH